jgi:hypothetical protein
MRFARSDIVVFATIDLLLFWSVNALSVLRKQMSEGIEPDLESGAS